MGCFVRCSICSSNDMDLRPRLFHLHWVGLHSQESLAFFVTIVGPQTAQTKTFATFIFIYFKLLFGNVTFSLYTNTDFNFLNSSI